MSCLRLILADQLAETISSLENCDKAHDVVLMCEVMEEAAYVQHHKKKIAFLFSAMRHFAEFLQTQDYRVVYTKLDDPENTGSFIGEITRHVNDYKCTRVIVTEPGEYRVLQDFLALKQTLNVEIEIRPDTRFLASHDDFKKWTAGKKQLRMEYFYREMRKKYNILIDAQGKPVGGEWNYDKENRKSPTGKKLNIPKRIAHKKSAIVEDVLALVANRFVHHFGELTPFHFAVTREQALIEMHDFMAHILPNFGDYQDAMVAGEPYLYHSLLSTYVNAGLLLPLEICEAAQAAYAAGNVPLNAAEGFIRQILGWREYIRGIYWLSMPEYAALNYFKAERKLPDFYWTAKTDMFCMAETVRHTRDHAYSHHIQRLMITGNFALLAGLDPVEVCSWYLAVYADAYEWVELPNTLGMALYGDGGVVGSKPYAASGKYINRMSNYCGKCKFDPEISVGDKACPFNALYWDFLVRNEGQLRGNQRMPYVFATWDKMSKDKQQELRLKAQDTLQKLENNNL